MLSEQAGDPTSPAAEPYNRDAKLAPDRRAGHGLGSWLLTEHDRIARQQRDRDCSRSLPDKRPSGHETIGSHGTILFLKGCCGDPG
jgi:hypothetical protein